MTINIHAARQQILNAIHCAAAAKLQGEQEYDNLDDSAERIIGTILPRLKEIERSLYKALENL